MFENLGLESKYKCERPILMRSISSGIGKPRPVSKLGDGFNLYDLDDDLPVYRPRRLHQEFDQYVSFPAIVRCGKCAGCRKFQSDEWFVRCCHHLSSNKDLYPLFVTFTFSPEGWRYICDNYDLFPDGEGKLDYTLVYKSIFPDLKKRLRAERGSDLDFDYFLVSEFGEKRGRFHLHCIFFFRGVSSFSLKATLFCRKWPRLRHFVVNKKAHVKRLQTDLEVYLQHHIERNFTYTVGSKRDFTPYFRRAENGATSVYYKNQFGYVTAFSTTNFGMFKYVSNYTNKCLKDGVSTFRRFSPGLGFAWAFEHISSLLLRSSSSLPLGCDSSGRKYNYPIPRAYFRKVCPRSHFLDYCLGPGRLKALSFAYKQFKDNISSLLEGISYFFNPLKPKNLCTKFVSETLLSLKTSLLSLPQLFSSRLQSCPAFALV